MFPKHAVDQCLLFSIFLERLSDHPLLSFYVNLQGLKSTRGKFA